VASGAGIAFTCCEDGTVLMVRRSQHVDAPGTWAFPGGMVEPGENALMAASREVEEELGLGPTEMRLRGDVVTRGPDGFLFKTFVVDITLAEKTWWSPRIRLNWESDAVVWFVLGVPVPQAHPGAAEVLKRIECKPKRRRR
jgi:8-oxo-dGTP pyrophosphatase MutT (NUDIX family)